jgi:hypothetical protein
MGTIILVLGSGLLIGSALLLYWFFAHPGVTIPAGVSALEVADFPRVAGLLEGTMMFAFGTFLFAFGLAWLLSGGATG